jgi:hypothetical protein
MVNFGDALRKGLGFCIEPKRWLPLLILDTAALAVVLATLLGSMSVITETFINAQNDPLGMASLSGYFIGIMLLGIVWYIVRMWIMGSLIHQSLRPREIKAGYMLSLSRLHKVIATVLIVAFISGLAGAVPYVGLIFSLVLSWAFFFIFQGIIIDNLGIVSTLKNSWLIFRKSPFDVFVAWLLIAVISALIMGLFALPLMSVLFGLIFSSIMASGSMAPGVGALLTVYLQNNLAELVALGAIALVGLELSQAFAIKAQTEFYLQFKRKFPNILKMFKGKAGRFF